MVDALISLVALPAAYIPFSGRTTRLVTATAEAMVAIATTEIE